MGNLILNASMPEAAKAELRKLDVQQDDFSKIRKECVKALLSDPASGTYMKDFGRSEYDRIRRACIDLQKIIEMKLNHEYDHLDKVIRDMINSHNGYQRTNQQINKLRKNYKIETGRKVVSHFKNEAAIVVTKSLVNQVKDLPFLENPKLETLVFYQEQVLSLKEKISTNQEQARSRIESLKKDIDDYEKQLMVLEEYGNLYKKIEDGITAAKIAKEKILEMKDM
jgi:gas vesicle protein